MIAVGLVITVVGLGDKGFHSLELKLVGPIIVVCGGVLACVRILMCTLPHTQCGKRWCVCWVGEGGDKEKLLRTENQFKNQRGDPLVSFENREVELRYENCDPTCFVRECEERVVGGYRQIIKPVRLLHNNGHNGSLKNSQKLSEFPHKTEIVSDFVRNGQDCYVESCSDSESETFSVFEGNRQNLLSKE